MADTKPKGTKEKTFVAVVGISSPAGRFEAGDDVPAELVEKHPWLVKRNKVRGK